MDLSPPAPPQIPATDPLLDAQAAAASAANIKALQQQTAGDSASLMARYGTRLALSNAASGSPLIASAAVAGRAGP